MTLLTPEALENTYIIESNNFTKIFYEKKQQNSTINYGKSYILILYIMIQVGVFLVCISSFKKYGTYSKKTIQKY